METLNERRIGTVKDKQGHEVHIVAVEGLKDFIRFDAVDTDSLILATELAVTKAHGNLEGGV